MNDNTLNLYCPHCKAISEVVSEGHHFVCVECGWQFSQEISSKFVSAPEEAARATPPAAPVQSGLPDAGLPRSSNA